MQEYTVYILKSLKDNKHYIGCTNNLERRLKEHNCGEVKSTKHRRPLKLIHSENFLSSSKARIKEKFYKTGQGREKIKLFKAPCLPAVGVGQVAKAAVCNPPSAGESG